MDYTQTNQGLHWFDWLVLVLLLLGAANGWRLGSAREVPRLVLWLLIIAIARPLAIMGGNAAAFLGLSEMGGRLCAFGWAMALLNGCFP